jgi:ankyrin repeat protein
MKMLKIIIISAVCGVAVGLLCYFISSARPGPAEPMAAGLQALAYFIGSFFTGLAIFAVALILQTKGVSLKIVILVALIPVAVTSWQTLKNRYGKSDFEKHLEKINAPMTNPWGTTDKDTLLAQLRKGKKIDRTNKLGQTLLHYAAYTNDLDLMKFCVERGANVNKKDRINLGHPPAYYTHRNENGWMLLDYLLENGADLSLYTLSGDALIFYAAESASPEELSVLIKHGASANTTGWGNYTPIFRASTPEKAQILIDAGADVNHRSASEIYPTPLHNHLIRDSHEDIIQLLIAAGADIEVRNRQGNTPLLKALRAVAWSGNAKAKALILLNSGADIHVKNNDGNTPLLIAADAIEADKKSAEDLEWFQTLIERRADKTAVNKDGKTAYDIALKKGFPAEEIAFLKGSD